MVHGFVCLAAVLHWFSRRVLCWRVSISLDTSFYIEAMEEALVRHGQPQIFNTDQASQFASTVFTEALKKAEIAISVDCRGAGRDSGFVERLRRTIKYEEVYLRFRDSVSEVGVSIGRYLTFCNAERSHSGLEPPTPDEAYFNQLRPIRPQHNRSRNPLIQTPEPVQSKRSTSLSPL